MDSVFSCMAHGMTCFQSGAVWIMFCFIVAAKAWSSARLSCWQTLHRLQSQCKLTNWCLNVLANWRVIGSFDSFDHSSFAHWNYSADERIGVWHSGKSENMFHRNTFAIRVPEHALVWLRSPALRTRVCGDLVGRMVGAVNGTNNYHGACLLVRRWASMSMATLSPSQTVGAKWLCQQLYSKQSRYDSICIEAWLATHCVWLCSRRTGFPYIKYGRWLGLIGPYNSHIIHVCLYHFKNTNPMILSLQHRNSSVPVITSACRCACAFGHGHCLIARYCWYCSSVGICAQSVVSHTNHIKYIIIHHYYTIQIYTTHVV